MNARRAPRERRPAAGSTVIALVLASCGPGGSQSAAPEPDAPAASDAAASLLATLPDGIGPALVSLEPLAEAASAAPDREAPAPPVVIDQFAYTFLPPLAIALRGQLVRFGNSDDGDHNVRVTQAETRAVVVNADMKHNNEIEHRFEHTGPYTVRCEIHPAMKALILVVSHPYAAIADARGSFRVEDIPEGSYVLTAWGVAGERFLQQDVQVRTDGNGGLAMSLIASD